MHGRARNFRTIDIDVHSIVPGRGKHHVLERQNQMGFRRRSRRGPGLHNRMSLDREDRDAVGIIEIHGKGNTALKVTLPLDDADKYYPVLSGRKVWRA